MNRQDSSPVDWRLLGIGLAILLTVSAPIGAAIAVQWATPTWKVPPTFPPDYVVGYAKNSAGTTLTFGDSGQMTSIPNCPGSWVGGTGAGIPSYDYSERTTLGFNASLARVAIERNTGGILTHREWVCSTTATAAIIDCSDDMALYSLLPNETPATLAPLEDGWHQLGTPMGNTSTLMPEFLSQPATLNVMRLRGTYDLGTVPFTGTVYWKAVTPNGAGFRSQSYLFGNCLGDGASNIGFPQRYSPAANTIEVGTGVTNGVFPFIQPVPPAGDWQVSIEACNTVC